MCNDSTTCSGNGKCNATLDCECDSGWNGRFCNFCQKNRYGNNCNVYCDSSITCSSHGYCNIEGQCNCFNDSTSGYWSFADCGSCMNGYYGELCSTLIIGPSQFTDLGNGIIFKLFAPVSYSQVNIDCSLLIHPNEKNLYGENPVCMWIRREEGTFFIQFGDRYEMKPQMNISLNRLVFDQITTNTSTSSSGSSGSESDYENIQVNNANNPVKPIAII